jgi:hypothetical protein
LPRGAPPQLEVQRPLDDGVPLPQQLRDGLGSAGLGEAAAEGTALPPLTAAWITRTVERDESRSSPSRAPSLEPSLTTRIL